VLSLATETESSLFFPSAYRLMPTWREGRFADGTIFRDVFRFWGFKDLLRYPSYMLDALWSRRTF